MKVIVEFCANRNCVIINALLIVCVLGAQAFAAKRRLNAQARRVAGIVKDERGAPIADAQVDMRDGMHVIAQIVTKADGQFAFDSVPMNANLTLTISARGFSASARKLNANEVDLSQLEITLAPAPLSEDVTVTATRTATRLGETAASISTISRAELSTTAALTIDDALRQIPGFQLFRRSGSRTANPTSQGVSLRATGASGASRALVLWDGIPLNDPFGGWVYWDRVPREEVERIEILRGGASNLYGSAALGGVVQIFSRDAVERTASLELSYGNEQTPDGSLFLAESKNGWGASLAAESFRTEGYIPVAKDERGRVDTLAGSRHATLDLTLEKRFGDTARFFVRGANFGEARANGTPLQTNRTHLRQASAGGDWQWKTLGAFSLRAYGGTEVFDQNFSSIALDRNSENLTRVQRSPSQFIGLRRSGRAPSAHETVWLPELICARCAAQVMKLSTRKASHLRSSARAGVRELSAFLPKIFSI